MKQTFFLLLAFHFFCWTGIHCGDHQNVISSRGSFEDQNFKRLGHTIGPVRTLSQMQQQFRNEQFLLTPNDYWVGVDEEGEEIEKTFFTVKPFGNTYQFDLVLPDPDHPKKILVFKGEKRLRNIDSDFLFDVHLPWLCANSFIHARLEGETLQMIFSPTCETWTQFLRGEDPQDLRMDFRKKSSLKNLF